MQHTSHEQWPGRKLFWACMTQASLDGRQHFAGCQNLAAPHCLPAALMQSLLSNGYLNGRPANAAVVAAGTLAHLVEV